jgi:hypothetical protein
LTAPTVRRLRGEGSYDNGYKFFIIDGRKVGEHVLVAERALGRRLPAGVEVHHFNEVRSDNRPGNLVVCPSTEYHRLLHVRQAALDASGHADWRKCTYCKQYDAPENIQQSTTGGRFHRACRTTYESEARRQRLARLRATAAA